MIDQPMQEPERCLFNHRTDRDDPSYCVDCGVALCPLCGEPYDEHQCEEEEAANRPRTE